MTRPRLLVSIPLVLVAVALLGFPLFAHEGHGDGEVAPFDLDTPRQVSPQTAAHIGLQTAEIDFGSVEEVVRLTGIVRPVPEMVHSVSSRVQGTVLTIGVQVGDVVQEGDLLVEIESPQLVQSVYELRTLETESYALQTELIRARSRIDELEVELDTARQHATIAKGEFERGKDSDGAVAASVLSQRQGEAVRTQGKARLTDLELSLARAELESMTRQADSMDRSREALERVIATMANADPPGRGEDVAGTGTTSLLLSSSPDEWSSEQGVVRFYSPISGVVIQRSVVAGEGVDAGESLLTVAQYSRVQVEGELPESLVNRAGDLEGKEVRVRRVGDAGVDAIATGTVRFVSPVIDPIKRTTHVVVEVENLAGDLRDGLYVDLAVVLRAEDSAVVVPVSAVVTDGPMHFVFVKDGEFYTKQDIFPGTRDDRVIEVKDGLLPGDIVVVRGAYSLTQLRPKAPAPSADDSSDG